MVRVRTRFDGLRVWGWLAVIVGGLLALGVSVGRVWVVAGGSVWVPPHWSLIRGVGAVLVLAMVCRVYALGSWPPGVAWWLWHRVGALLPILGAGVVAWHETAGHIGGTADWLGELWTVAGYGLVLVGAVTLAGRRRFHEEASASAAAAMFSALNGGVPDPRRGRWADADHETRSRAGMRDGVGR